MISFSYREELITPVERAGAYIRHTSVIAYRDTGEFFVIYWSTLPCDIQDDTIAILGVGKVVASTPMNGTIFGCLK
jgi:hypothetical protein